MSTIIKDKLTSKQEKFIDEYMIDLNATQAAIRAGYAASSAKVSGHNNITNYNINQAILKRKQALSKKTEYSQEIGLSKLLHAYDVAEQLRQPSAMVSAAIGANRMHGFDKEAGAKDATIIIINPPNSAKSVESEEVE